MILNEKGVMEDIHITNNNTCVYECFCHAVLFVL
jgi:hypothetical protein